MGKNHTIRLMIRDDAETIIDMMRVFYASPAVLSNGSEEIFRNDVENCVNDSPYLEGYVIEVEEENERAIKTYRKCGFEVLPYMEMKR